MSVRLAAVADIEQMHRVRLSVRENVLTSVADVTPERYRQILEHDGAGWVFEDNGRVVGFAMADDSKRNVWALFVHPGYERRGIGRALHDSMLRWMFERSSEPVWLVTSPDTRAERFYERAGWHRCGVSDSGEVRFEMRPES
jgi:GNAT superfamily N-acetyltransferase